MYDLNIKDVFQINFGRRQGNSPSPKFQAAAERRRGACALSSFLAAAARSHLGMLVDSEWRLWYISWNM
jgi:hypothetical protein